MTDIPIYDFYGNQINNLHINDTLIRPSIGVENGRVSKGTKHYYKGVGVYYNQHNIDKVAFDPELYDFVSKADVFYLGYNVRKKAFVGKFGIFNEPFLPMFTDFIGSCGVKEMSIIEHSMLFEMSSVDVIKCVDYDIPNGQCYFIVDYKCQRRRYLDEGDPHKLKQLIEYSLGAHWNFLWDKDAITDIAYNGMVTDVCELFYSKDIKHKLGSVYSIIYSLGKRNFKKYIEFLNVVGLEHKNEKSYIFNTVELLKQNNIDVSMLLDRSEDENYKRIIVDYLIVGKNCGHCSLVNAGEHIKEIYLKTVCANLGYYGAWAGR